MRRVVHVLLVLGLCAPACCGQGTTIKVLPWDNHPAAISLTFDDARPVQLDVAVPELNKRHLHATFFVIVSKLTRLDDWRKVQHAGHEIGNHSLTHPHPDGLSKGDEELQIEDAKRFLDSNFQSDILTFAYPYAEISAGFSYWVKRYNFAARGWRGDNNLLYVAADNDPDWYNLPSQPTNTQYDFDVYKSWVDHALSINAWTTLQIHGIGDVSTGYEPIPTATFISLLNYLRVEQDKGLWVAPFGEVAAYLRAQRVIEKSQPQIANQDEAIRWDLPQPFPKGVVLKVTLRGQDRCRLFQTGHELPRGKDGTYSLSFDAKELVIRGRA